MILAMVSLHWMQPNFASVDLNERVIGYTNHTVLPEAPEKWSIVVMKRLLPRHMEIIEETDKRLMAMVRATRSDLESKLPSLCIMDSSNPEKSVVRVANSCVVTAHTVNGVT